MKKRILFISSNTGIGGQETVIKRLLKHIDGNLYRKDVLIAFDKGALHDEYEKYSDNLYYAEELQGDQDAYTVLFNLIQENKYDVVHFFNLWIMYDAIIRIKRTFPKVRVMTTLCVDLHYHQDGFAQEIRYAEKIQPHLWASITDAKKNRNVLPDITVIRNGCDPELFKPAPKKPKTVAWVSRLFKEKRAHLIPEIARQLPDYHFVMVGARDIGVYDEIIKDLPPNLDLRLAQTEVEVAELLSDTQYFLFTSISEAMPLTIMEAMASECCVISENIGDISTMLIDGFNGHLIPKDTNLVNWVVENLPKLDLSVTENARQTIIDDFDIEQTVKKYEFFYDTIGSHGGQPRLAFLWDAPSYKKHWDEKIDALQNTIAKLSRDNVVQIFTTVDVSYTQIIDHITRKRSTWITDDKKRYKNIINGQNIFFCNCRDHREFIIELKKFNPDMIFMHTLHTQLWKRVDLAFPKAWKSIQHFGSPELFLERGRDVDMFFVQQEYLRKPLALDNNFPPEHIGVIPFGIETDFFKPLDTEKTYTGVMFADFRKEIKRQHLLIQAWKDIPGRLLLIGRFERSLPPEYVDKCKHLAETCGVRDRIDFLDGVLHDKAPAILNKAKIAFLTSAREGGSIALMEMMACGLPAIVLKDCHGNVNRVRPGIDSLLAAPTYKSIAEMANRLLAMDWKEMGRRASKRIHREFRYDSMYEFYQDLVERVMEERRCQKFQ